MKQTNKLKELPKDLQELSRKLNDPDVMREINENQKEMDKQAKSIRDMTKISYETLHRKYK